MKKEVNTIINETDITNQNARVVLGCTN